MTDAVPPVHPSQESQSGKPRANWGRWTLLLLVLGGGTLLFLPTILGKLFISPSAVAWLSGQPEGRITVGEAMLSWQGPAQVKNVTIRTADGEPIADVRSITSEWTLWDILTQSFGTLKLKLEGIEYAVVVPDPGPPEGRLDLSHFTQAIQNFQFPVPNQPMEVHITNSTLIFQNPQKQEVDRWENLSGTYQYQTTPELEQKLSLSIPESSERGTGSSELNVHWSVDRATSRELVQFKGQGDRLSLRAADPWMVKYIGPGHGFEFTTGTVASAFQRHQESGWQLTGEVQMGGAGLPRLSDNQVAFLQNEAQATLEFQGQYSKADDQLSIPQLDLVADQAAVELQGVVTHLSGVQNVDVLGSVKTPGNAFGDLLPAELQQQIQIEGMKVSELSINGSLLPGRGEASKPLIFSLIAEWDKATAYGLESEKGSVKVSLSEGIVRAEPINVPLGGGRLLRLPSLNTNTEPPLLQFEEGVMLQNVTMNESICRDWMMYVSPTLANATSATGQFSLSLEKGEIPLGQIEKGQLGGTVSIREAAVHPGPLAIAILDQVAQVQALLNRGGLDLTKRAFLTMKAEDILFRLQEGRVYHKNFGANVGEMRISTAGSVGLDQTLGMNLYIAFPEKWLAADRPVLAALASEPIVVGVSGTMSQPRMDGAGLAEFGKQLGVKAGIGILEKIIERRQQRGR